MNKFKPVLHLVALALVSGPSPVMAAEPSEAPHEQYRVLAWKDLVPDGWEPPLVSRAYDEVSEADVDDTSVVNVLDGELAALPGYMKPVVYEGNEVSEFLPPSAVPAASNHRPRTPRTQPDGVRVRTGACSRGATLRTDLDRRRDVPEAGDDGRGTCRLSNG